MNIGEARLNKIYCNRGRWVVATFLEEVAL